MSHTQFLAAIREKPDDDALRLVYADWLEEQGDPRADLIRVQCQLARLDAWDAERPALQRRESNLLARSQKTWLEALPRLAGIEWGWLAAGEVFSRGLVEYATLKPGSAPPWAEVADVECIRRVRLLKLGSEVEDDEDDPDWARNQLHDLGNAPLGANLVELSMVTNPVRLTELNEIASAASLRGLTRLVLWRLEPGAVQGLRGDWAPRLQKLEVSRSELDDTALGTLADWAPCANLKELDLSSNSITAAGLKTLLARCNSLESLELGSNSLGSDALSVLARSPHSASLRRLGLERVNLSDRGIFSPDPPDPKKLEEFAESKHLAGIRDLSLGVNSIDEIGVAHLTGPALAHLYALSLNHNPIGPGGAEILATSPTFAALKVLKLGSTRLGARGVQCLAAGGLSPWVLDLSRNELTAADVAALVQSPQMASITSLNVASNPIGDAGVAAIAESPHLKNLEALYLHDTGMDTAGAQALARSANLAHVRKLFLSMGSGFRNAKAMSDAAARALSKSPYLQELETLHATANKKGAEMLQARFGAAFNHAL